MKIPRIVLPLLCLPLLAAAAEVPVRVDDGSLALADAVVSLHGEQPTTAGDGSAVMDQRNTAFVPGVLPIRVGTSVSFPNSDTVQHQVYSFSPTKPFELPLYSGTPLAPVRFDRAGVVVVGCNIHDWMIGHIVVLDTPHFGKTGADGRVRISVPAGRYRLRVWHSRLAGEAQERPVQVGEGQAEISESLILGPPLPTRQGSERLRALQERVRALKGGN